jgi:hypothetical protein
MTEFRGATLVGCQNGNPLSQMREACKLLACRSDIWSRDNGGTFPAPPTWLSRAVWDATPGSIPRLPWYRLSTSRRLSTPDISVYSFRSTLLGIDQLTRSLSLSLRYVNSGSYGLIRRPAG